MESPTIPIDPNGDLTLIVGADDDVRMFLVSSKALTLASPVWRAMLSTRNGFKEAGSEEISFPDDKSEALFIVLLTCHLRFQEVPKKVEFKTLMDLCTVCDKYDCISLLQPWFSAWMSPWLKHVGQHGYEGWAFIAWVIGDVDIFKRAIDHVVLNCKMDESGQCLTKDGNEVLDDLLTHGLTDAVLEARVKTITRLIEACHAIMHKYISSPRPLCENFEHEEECDALVIGSLVKPLQTMRLWPGDPKQIAVCITDANVENISSKIEGIQNYIYPVRDKYSGSHSGCGFTTKLHNTTNEILKDKAADVVKANRKHLEIQRGKFEPSLAPLKLG